MTDMSRGGEKVVQHSCDVDFMGVTFCAGQENKCEKKMDGVKTCCCDGNL